MNFIYNKISVFSHKRGWLLLPLVVLVALAVAQRAAALPVETYAENSRLASGRWVKISVGASGMYMLTDQELRQWGFSNPANVKVYGLSLIHI